MKDGLHRWAEENNVISWHTDAALCKGPKKSVLYHKANCLYLTAVSSPSDVTAELGRGWTIRCGQEGEDFFSLADSSRLSESHL